MRTMGIPSETSKKLGNSANMRKARNTVTGTERNASAIFAKYCVPLAHTVFDQIT